MCDSKVKRLYNHITDVISGKYKQYKGYTFKLV
jgi:hypothetical protein